jgi:phosphomannomutase
LVDVEAIKKANFKVAIDCVNSTGGIFVPALLKALGVEVIHEFIASLMATFRITRSHCQRTW